MYKLVKSIALSRSIGSQWSEPDLSSILVFNIFDTYSKVYLVLKNPVLTNEVYVDLDILKNEFSSYTHTLADLLIELNDRKLATVTTVPSTKVKFVKYSDAFRSQYKIDLCRIGQSAVANYPVSELKDIRLSRPKYATDTSMIFKYCLVTVNGMVHRLSTDGTYTYVAEAGNSLRYSGNNQLGILSFLDVGKVTQYQIFKEDIKPQEPGSTLKEKVFFKIQGNTENKACVLILGGYMIFESDLIFKKVGTNLFSLDLNHIPFIERLYESQRYIDLSNLELSSLTNINTIEAFSDANIIKYMTLSQSFLVTVDVSCLSVNKIHLRNANLPGMFTSYQEPTYPFFTAHGKMAEYWKVEEDGHWSVTVEDSFYRNMVIQHQPQKLLDTNNNMIPSQPFFHGRGYLLEIAGFNL